MGDNRHVKLDDTKERQLHIDRSTNYAGNCKNGYRGAYWNAHHAIPCTSIQTSIAEFLKGKAYRYNQALSWFTVWDVNAGHNLVGLPHQRAYEMAYRSQISVQKKTMWLKAVKKAMEPKYAVHLSTAWGHVAYNKQVKGLLDPIWDVLTDEIKKHNPTSGPDLGETIKGVGSTFKARVQKLGQTKEGWKKDRFSGPFMMA